MLAIGTPGVVEIVLPAAGGALLLGHSVVADGVDPLSDHGTHIVKFLGLLGLLVVLVAV